MRQTTAKSRKEEHKNKSGGSGSPRNGRLEEGEKDLSLRSMKSFIHRHRSVDSAPKIISIYSEERSTTKEMIGQWVVESSTQMAPFMPFTAHRPPTLAFRQRCFECLP